MSFGSDLRREREHRGISLEAIAAGTKVSQKHLTALEHDSIAELPGGVFNKGFVRSYCHYVGLDEAQWTQRYAEAFEANQPDVDWAQFAENVKRNRAPGPPTGLRWWGVALMFAAVAAAGWAVWHFLLHGKLPAH